MPLHIETIFDDDIAVFELAGALTLGPYLVSLRNAVRDVLSKPGLSGIVLEVTKVTAVDSSGLGELTIVYSSASRRNCPMKLVGVTSNLQKMLKMTHLDAVLASAADLATAKKQLKSH